jgi:protein-disulfide isomerase
MAPNFQEATVTAGEGKDQRAQLVLVSDDSRFLIVVLGSVMNLSQNSSAEMVARIKETFKTPPSLKLSVGGFKPSPSPDFQQGVLTMDDGKSPKQEKGLLLSRDGKHLIVSEMYPLGIDPKQQALHTISLHDVPTQGPADAPVTIVEYADLECPTCARMQEFLETKVVPRYGNKVRIVFKEFPLAMHDWSMTAAIACQCAYEINPASYVPLRTTIFRNQTLINITNLRESLLSYGEQVGVDRVRLAGCLDARSSKPRVQRDMDEAKRIDVNQTPTLYINGRMLFGLSSEDAYYQAIDEALKGSRQ